MAKFREAIAEAEEEAKQKIIDIERRLEIGSGPEKTVQTKYYDRRFSFPRSSPFLLFFFFFK